MKARVEEGRLVDYLRSIALAGAFVVSISSTTLEVGSTFQSALELSNIAQSDPDYFGIGPYWVESDSSNIWKEKQPPDAVISGYAIAFTLIARLKRSGEVIGGYEELTSGLSDYEYLLANDPKADHGVGHLIVKLPTDPSELKALKLVLQERSITYIIDDGSGEVHMGNIFMGNGLYFKKV